MTDNIFSSNTYRDLIRVGLARRPSKQQRLAQLADAIRVQRPYLSKVMHGSADLNRDQFFLACRFLALAPEETEFANLLLERDRSVLTERRSELTVEIERVRDRHREIEKNLEANAVKVADRDLAKYYLSPILLLLHMGLTIGRFREKPSRLQRALGLERTEFEAHLGELATLGLITAGDDKITILKDHIHLPKDSVLFAAHQALLRSLCQHRLRKKVPGDTSFSVTFSATEETREKIRQRFLQFMRETEVDVRGGVSENIFQMNFDLFSWTSGRGERS